MNQEQILMTTENWVKSKLEKDASGHDWWHIVRVRNTAKTIAEQEEADLFICLMAALLHDMADEKLNVNPEKAEEEVVSFLENQIDDKEIIESILYIIRNISFKAGKGITLKTLEAQIVQDADRLDAIGAIGIARCMAYSGHKGRLIHDPNMKPRENLTVEDYRNGQDTAIMHFYEKLLTLKDKMNTPYGREMAQLRHDYLLSYLDQFYAEWDGLR